MESTAESMNSVGPGPHALFIMVARVPGTKPESRNYINVHYYNHVHEHCPLFNSSRLLLNYIRVATQTFNMETPTPLKLHSDIFEGLEMLPKDFLSKTLHSENHRNQGTCFLISSHEFMVSITYH